MEENMQIVPASCKSLVEAQYVEMKVPLYSYGCHKKIKGALSHLKGIYSINVDYEQQKVTVWGICNKMDVLSSIRSKRRAARFWTPDDDANSHHQSLGHQALDLADALPSDSSPTGRHPPNPAALALIKFKAPSLGWKSWKKIFIRSYSFS
ncbi:OLC1v1020951C1 [Oldenlandia corymbosa var. corymbosa]|uniref:OLC1v1020951C1 n=1 Tax=Oldenlandia corymbosa var. corymbosa TaxID=529605 RepID=A0AAV1BWU6_OLDCO|nr:OLC1v1020951C1 [Oldenlandia corymbosa var. corymbosa]